MTCDAGDEGLLHSAIEAKDGLEISFPGVLAGVRKARRDIAQRKTYSLKEVFGS